MAGATELVLVLLGSPAAILCTHAVLARLARNASPQVTAVRAVVAGGIPTAWLLLRLCHVGGTQPMMASAPATALYCALVYGALGYVYFHVFNMSETARRIRLLLELRKKSPSTPEDLLSAYPCEELVAVRLERLTRWGSVARSGDDFVLRKGILFFAARALEAWRGLLFPQRRP